MQYTRTVDPTSEPVSLAEAKAHLRVDLSDDDDKILRLIVGAREHAENFMRKSICTQTWQARLNKWEDVIFLRRPPLVSVSKVEYVDTAGATQTLDAADYDVDTVVGCLYPDYGKTWPSVRSQRNAITITYVAGYGGPSGVPEQIKQGMYLLIEAKYDGKPELVEVAELCLWDYRELLF